MATGFVSPTAIALGHCGDASAVEILELQPAGKRRMSVQDFLRGNTITPDARMGRPD